jgi:hypothetical protein
MAALAISAYGVHRFALGWNGLKQADPRVSLGMALAFTLISVLGAIVFAKAKDYRSWACSSGRPASLRHPGQPGRERAGSVPAWHQADGVLHLGVGIWLMYLMYLMFATVLDLVFKYTLYL